MVRLGVKFACTVCSASGPVVSVVGDDRPAILCMSDVMRATCVYKGEVAQMSMVPDLVGRFDGVIDGLRSLVDVARGSVGGVTGNVFEEVEERFAHPSVCVHHERDELDWIRLD